MRVAQDITMLLGHSHPPVKTTPAVPAQEEVFTRFASGDIRLMQEAETPYKDLWATVIYRLMVRSLSIPKQVL